MDMLWNGYREHRGNWKKFFIGYSSDFVTGTVLGFFRLFFLSVFFFFTSSRSPLLFTPSIISRSLVPPVVAGQDYHQSPYLVCAGSPAKWHIPFLSIIHYSF
ncbi:hypothetical protein V2G26_010250 [Clonostachys chloroleuca]